MTFQSSIVDSLILCLLWSGMCLSFTQRKYDQPPSITDEPKPYYCRESFCDVGNTVIIYVKELETARIRCIASGRPRVSYTWTKNGEEFNVSGSRISLESGIGTLLISNATKDDEGDYQCSATNIKGTALSKIAKVILAINEPFKSVTTPFKVSVIEGMPTSLRCEQPYVVPKPNVYWKNSADPAQDRVILNERIAIDYEGTLHFANVLKTDEQQDGKYICNMYNSIYRTTSEGEDKELNVSPSKSVNVVSLLWSSNKNVLGLKGDEAKFMCIFAGKNTPNITWKRTDGKWDNKRMVVSQFGHELTITDLDFGDTGNYECSAVNDLTTTPVVEKFTLKVEARPYWVNKAPVDVLKGVEENAEFECLVEGKPDPVVEWFINTKPIAAVNNPRRTLQKNRLVFRNLSDTDSQVIQCKASNMHGSLMADVYLNVLALKPEITKGPGEVKAAEDNSVTMSCEHNGKPDPVLKWKKGSQPLNTDRYELTHNTITIHNLTSSDDGLYTCVASNRYGQEEETGQLVVRKKTTVSLRPDIKTLVHGDKATFSCIVNTDHNERKNLVVTWYKNGKPVELNDNLLITDTLLTIPKTTSKDSGNYSCHADNTVDKASDVSELKVQAPPEPPFDVMITTCGKLKATLKWEPGFDNFLNISTFIIYSKTFYDSDFVKMTQTIGSINKVELDLSPYANYTFKVSAVNQLGESVQSNQTNICETQEAPPAHHPKGVRIVENETGKLVIEWEPIKPIDQNGKDFKYLITTKRKSNPKKSYEVREWQDTRKVIDVGLVYEEYSVEVKAANIKGEATGTSYIYTGHSGMGKPSVIPQNFEIDPEAPYSHKSIGFRWDAVDTSDVAMQGKFNGYKLRYWDIDQPEKMKFLEVHVDGEEKTRRRKREAENKVRATVRLPPYTTLQLDVVARNTYYDSDGSNVINVTTPEGVPGPVVELTAKKKGGNFIVLQWQIPMEQNGIIIGYDVEYVKIEGLAIDKKSTVVKYLPEWVEEYQMYSIRVTGLELRTKYRFHVWARTSVGRGDEMYVDAMTAAEIKPTEPIIQSAIPGKTFVNVSWMINRNDTAGFDYYVEHRRYGDVQFIRGQVEQRNNFFVVSNLTSGQTYDIRVVAQSGHYVSASTTKTVTTTGTAAVASAVYEATWFIIMMVVLALLLLIVIIVCLVKRSRGDKYHVQEKEKLRGLENDEKKTAQYNGFSDNGETQPLAGSPDDYDKGPLESDKDSLEEYGDPDPSRFNEDGSFIGQYGAEKMTASEVAAPSAMHTFV